MKKIGIVTFNRAENYGAALQMYALQKFINDNIGKCEIIDYRNETVEKPYRLFYFKDKSFKSRIKGMIKGIFFLKKNLVKKRKYNKLFSEIPKSKEIKNISDIEEYDVIITGSDQVWNPSITLGLDDIYTLNFRKNKTKNISYAASIGKNEINVDEIDIYKQKLKNIDEVSVREENAKKSLEKIINKEIKVVLDPTLLLDSKQWNKILDLNKIKGINTKYILAYVIEPDNEYIKITNYISNETDLKVIHFSPRKRGLKNIYKNEYEQGPLEFINLIKNAEYVICTSFHATVFSIIFNKKFWVIPHRKTGSRVTNLLDKLGISERAVNSLEEFKKIDYDKAIDYERVNKKLEEERKKSIDWLNNAINS